MDILFGEERRGGTLPERPIGIFRERGGMKDWD